VMGCFGETTPNLLIGFNKGGEKKKGTTDRGKKLELKKNKQKTAGD